MKQKISQVFLQSAAAAMNTAVIAQQYSIPDPPASSRVALLRRQGSGDGKNMTPSLHQGGYVIVYFGKLK